jgi:hypothetical protein
LRTLSGELGEYGASRLPIDKLDVLFSLAEQLIEHGKISDIDSNAGGKLAEGLAKKLYRHCWTIRQLCRVEDNFPKLGDIRRPDYASLLAIGRIALENYQALFEVFLEYPDNTDEGTYRRYIWFMKSSHTGNVQTDLIPGLDPTFNSGVTDNDVNRLETFERLRQLILTMPYFETLPDEYRIRTRRQLEKKKIRDLQITNREQADSLEAMGLSVEVVKFLRVTASSEIHSDAQSALPSAHQGLTSVEGYLKIIGILLGKLSCALADRLERCREICEHYRDTYAVARLLADAKLQVKLLESL